MGTFDVFDAIEPMTTMAETKWYTALVETFLSRKTRVYSRRDISPRKLPRAVAFELPEEFFDNEICALCNRTIPTIIDHNHQTGIVRGWICNSCNNRLTAIEKHLEWYGRAFDYLTNPPLKRFNIRYFGMLHAKARERK